MPPAQASASAAMTDALTPVSQAANADSERMRKLRFQRAMDRGLKSVRFDGPAWFASLAAAPEGRAAAARRVLLAYAPQAAGEASVGEPLAIVRQIVLDAAYQLK
jgi:hypothetical protein